MKGVNIHFIPNDNTRNGGNTLAYFLNTRQKNEDASWGICRGSDIFDEYGN